MMKMKKKKIRNIFLNSVENSSIFRLTINPTLDCNFRCWYCYETHKKNTKISNKNISLIKKLINNILDKFDTIEIAFFGGEPLLEFYNIILPLIKYTSEISNNKNKNYYITFTTNGYLINDEIIGKLKQYNIGLSQITLDGGEYTHNRTRISKDGNSFIRIINNIKKFTDANLPVLIRINVTKDNIIYSNDLISHLSKFSEHQKNNITISIQQVWQDIKNDIFDEILELYKKLDKIGYRIYPIKRDYIRSICYADKRYSAVINWDGRVFKCTALDFESTKEDGVLSSDGNLKIDNQFDIRLNTRFNNKLCKNCRILPLCNGGCSKNIDLSKGKEYCLYPTQKDKDRIIKSIIKEKLVLNNLRNRVDVN